MTEGWGEDEGEVMDRRVKEEGGIEGEMEKGKWR